MAQFSELQTALERPIGQWNCRHIVFYIRLGISEPRYSEEQLREWANKNAKGITIGDKHYSMYEVTQKQRQLETDIRRSKDLLTVAKAAGDNYLEHEARQKINQTAEKYKKLCGAAGLEYQSQRLAATPTQKLSQEGKKAHPPKEYDGIFDDFAELDLSQVEADAFSQLQALTASSGREYAIVIENGVAGPPFTSGLSDSVRIPLSNYGENITVLHSHTNATPLSETDFQLLLNKKVAKVGTIGYNSDAYVAYVGNGEMPSKEEFDEVAAWIRKDVDNGMLEDPRFFDWSREEKNYMAIREQSFRIAQHFKWTLGGRRING